MSDTYDKHPGKGFTPVAGYEPPAGSQAAAQRQRDLDAQRQRASDGGGYGGGGYGGRGSQGCFPAGTRVATLGGYTNIEDLRSGDLVLSFNLSRGEARPSRILGVKSHGLNRIWGLEFSDGGKMRTTSMHSFYSGGDWKQAHRLNPGDTVSCVAADGSITERKIVRSEKRPHMEVVYNLIVASNFNYLAEGAVVHSFTYFRRTRMAVWSLFDVITATVEHTIGGELKTA